MLSAEYILERNKVMFWASLRRYGTRVDLLDRSTSRWFYILFTTENFPRFKREMMELAIQGRKNPNFDRDLVTFEKVGSSDKISGLKLYVQRSEKSEWIDLKIMNKPEAPLLKIQLRAIELENVIEATTHLLLT